MSATSNFNEWSAAVKRFAAIANKSFGDALIDQGRLLINELIKRTPPFGGKTLRRMLEARHLPSGLLDSEIENATARAVGERRVEKDIRKTIYGVTGATLSEKQGPSAMKLDWGVLQKCEGKQAVRIFSRSDGTVYGVDVANFKASASMQEMLTIHRAARNKRGRVTTAGQRTRDIGRWRWLNILVTTEKAVADYVKSRKAMVGQAKGGWAEGYMQLGGRMSKGGWVGRHSKSGSASVRRSEHGASIEVTNNSAWASSGDQDRIIPKAFEGRAEAMEKWLERQIHKDWERIAA